MEMSEVFRELDDWIARPLPPGVEGTLERLRREEDAKRQALRQAQEELAQVQFQIAKIADAINLRRYLEARVLPAGDVVVVSPEPTIQNGSKPPQRGREAVMRLFSESPPDREWTIPQVVTALAAKGWADPDDTHAVGVSLSRLARAGKIHRQRKGVYTALPPGRKLDPPSSNEEASSGSHGSGRNQLFTGSVTGEPESKRT